MGEVEVNNLTKKLTHKQLETLILLSRGYTVNYGGISGSRVRVQYGNKEVVGNPHSSKNIRRNKETWVVEGRRDSKR